MRRVNHHFSIVGFTKLVQRIFFQASQVNAADPATVPVTGCDDDMIITIMLICMMCAATVSTNNGD